MSITVEPTRDLLSALVIASGLPKVEIANMIGRSLAAVSRATNLDAKPRPAEAERGGPAVLVTQRSWDLYTPVHNMPGSIVDDKQTYEWQWITAAEAAPLRQITDGRRAYVLGHFLSKTEIANRDIEIVLAGEPKISFAFENAKDNFDPSVLGLSWAGGTREGSFLERPYPPGNPEKYNLVAKAEAVKLT